MRTRETRNPRPRMSSDAYAGFLKLWLTPTGTLPARTPEVDAYLAYANHREPLPPSIVGMLESETERAA